MTLTDGSQRETVLRIWPYVEREDGVVHPPGMHDGLEELRALVEMLNRRGIRVELKAGLADEAEWYGKPPTRMVVAVDLTPSRLRHLRRQVAERLLSDQW